MKKLEEERIEIEKQISWNFHAITVPNDIHTYIYMSRTLKSATSRLEGCIATRY